MRRESAERLMRKIARKVAREEGYRLYSSWEEAEEVGEAGADYLVLGEYYHYPHLGLSVQWLADEESNGEYFVLCRPATGEYWWGLAKEWPTIARLVDARLLEEEAE